MNSQVLTAVQAKIQAAQEAYHYAGLGVESRGNEIHIAIPDALRVGHEAHFAQVTRNFLKYVQDRSALPKWERPNMLAKYYVTTKGIDVSREGPPRPAPRIAPR